MADSSAIFQAPNGRTVAVKLIDTGVSDGAGNQLYRLAVDSAVSIDPGAITIGAITIKDNTSATQATVNTVTSVGEGDKALAVQAPVLGKTTDAVDLTGSTTTLNAKLRGLIQLIVAKISIKIADGDSATLGITTGAAVITDANGTVQQYLRGLIKLALSGTVHASQTVAPANQASTAAYVDFAGSTIDSLPNTVLSFTLLNTDGANGLTWKVLAANASDFSDSVIAQSGANIVAAAVGTFTANPPLYRYYKVQIIDTIGAAHATGQLRGIARG